MSRGPLLAFVIVAMIMFVYFLSKHKINIRHLFVVILIIAAVFFAWAKIGELFPWKTERLARIMQMPNFLRGGQSETESDTSFLLRSMLIKEQFREFIENPVFGFGFGNTDPGWEVHNMFLEVLYETGIIGAILFSIIIFMISNKIIRIWKKPTQLLNNQDSIPSIAIFIFLYSIIGGLMGTISPNLAFWFSAGLILNSFEMKTLWPQSRSFI
jgi:O-antigen ligase